ncbi:MarR family winged helix-turn-helix transcriptional regulator [Streptomyces sp. HMX112]|uniref:MarR family winged helix-turn-helix transcriptional regulator n=1 Tax=Streptomyces sp. HMX112 TaxID=3390850 RepID=UPI003A80272E
MGSRTRVSRLVDELVRGGLVRKQPDPLDKRVSWAVITEEGAGALRETAPVSLRSIRRHFSART